MTEKLSADENNDWRTRHSSLQQNQVQTTEQSGTTFYTYNNNYTYNHHHSYQKNNGIHYHNGTTFYPTSMDITPPPRSQAKLRPIPGQSDKSDNWRSTAAPLPPKPYCHPEDRNGANKKQFFAPYLSTIEIEKGIKKGTFYQGIMRLTKNRDDAYVTVDDLDADIYIGGASKRNRSLQGDLVAVRLLDDVNSIWNTKKERDLKKKQDKNLHNNQNEKVTNTPPKQEEDSDEEKDDHIPKYCGEVVGILLRPPDATYSGYISIHRFLNNNDNIAPGQKNNLPKNLNIAWFRPTDKRVPLMILRNQDIPKDLLENEEYYTTHLFSASIRRWQITDTSPIGKIIKELGPVGDLMVEREALISDNNVIATNFSSLALRNLPETPWTIPEKEFNVRRDYRKKCIFSIDPSTAKDLDDALHIEKLDDGYYEVGVHIADVSYFLRKGSTLDNEARSRGTSTYLVDSVIPMLPTLLCEELCSLNPGVDRLAFSVVWKMDITGEPVDTWFGKTIIRSCAKLAYGDAQNVLEGGSIPQDIEIHDKHDQSEIENNILLLNTIAKNKRKKRYAEGSLSLNSVKLNFELDEYGEPISVNQFQPKEANQLIEEFMLSANISVAKKITEAFPEEAFLRRHEEPLERRLNKFIQLTDLLGLDFDGCSAGALQESFNKVSNKNVKDVLLVLAIRCMQRAKYFCAGVADISKYGHYALNEPLYTHFTSPIRRYADVIVHRMLESAIKGKERCGYEKKSVQRIAFNCNSKKEGSRSAQDASINLYLSKYLFNLESSSGRPLYTQGVVITVAKEAFEVYVPKFGLEKKFFLEALPTEGFQFDKSTCSLDIFWKQGVPVTMHNEEQIYARERIRKDDYSDDENEDKEEDEFITSFDTTLNMSDSQGQERVRRDDNELVSPVILDPNTGLQRLKMFCSVDIRIQVNMTRSPPIINIYPVNPFSGEQVDKCI